MYVRCEGMNSWFQRDIFEADNNKKEGRDQGTRMMSSRRWRALQPGSLSDKKIKETNKEGLKMGSLWNYSQADFDAFLKVFD